MPKRRTTAIYWWGLSCRPAVLAPSTPALAAEPRQRLWVCSAAEFFRENSEAGDPSDTPGRTSTPGILLQGGEGRMESWASFHRKVSTGSISNPEKAGSPFSSSAGHNSITQCLLESCFCNGLKKKKKLANWLLAYLGAWDTVLQKRHFWREGSLGDYFFRQLYVKSLLLHQSWIKPTDVTLQALPLLFHPLLPLFLSVW